MKYVDRQSRTPLWRQVLADLQSRMALGEFDPHFPSDREIVETYRVSRHTAREAVRSLYSEGLLERGPGRGGTRIRSVEFKQPLGAIYSLFRAIESQGVKQESVVIAFDVRKNADKAARLGLQADTPLVYLERIRLADGIPLAHDRSWLPETLTKPILGSNMRHGALYQQLREKCGIIIDGGEEEIQPVMLDEKEATLLGTASFTPAFAIQRLARRAGTAIETRHTLIRGDRYSFTVTWHETSRTQVFDWGETANDRRW